MASVSARCTGLAAVGGHALVEVPFRVVETHRHERHAQVGSGLGGRRPARRGHRSRGPPPPSSRTRRRGKRRGGPRPRSRRTSCGWPCTVEARHDGLVLSHHRGVLAAVSSLACSMSRRSATGCGDALHSSRRAAGRARGRRSASSSRGCRPAVEPFQFGRQLAALSGVQGCSWCGFSS